MLGDECHRALGLSTRPPVYPEEILDRLGVHVEGIELADTTVRGISVLRHGRRPVVGINHAFRRGATLPIVRFTLAHELAHLLLDRERSAELAIASGPWAPRGVEQRANAFAAALLMPTSLVESAVGGLAETPTTLGGASTLAELFQVSLSSLADRLYNLGLLSRGERDGLRAHTVAGFG